jgi:hypothetical protein
MPAVNVIFSLRQDDLPGESPVIPLRICFNGHIYKV